MNFREAVSVLGVRPEEQALPVIAWTHGRDASATGGRPLRSILSIAAVLTLLAAALPSSALAQEPSRAVSPAPAIDPQELTFLRSVLGNAANALETRRRAATKLLRLPSPSGAATVVLLLDAGSGETRAALDAVFRNASSEDPELAAALVGALAIAAPADRPRLVETIGYAGTAIDVLVAEVAVDQTKGAEFRRTAIEALGRLRSRPSAEALLRVADPARNESPDLRNAAFRSLESISQLALGEDFRAWRTWLDQIGDDDALERTCEERAEALTVRLAQSERDRLSIDERADRTASRLRSALSELLLGMDLTARQERVQRLLGDELPTLRSFAIDQVERMLRNGDRIGDEMTSTLAGMLDDPVPSLRGRAARLLASLAWPSIGEEVASRLDAEEDPGVAVISLEILADRPAEGSMPALLRRMEAPATAESAARAVAKLQGVGLAPVGWRERAADIARNSLSRGEAPIPAMARVFALAGEASDADAIEALLDSSDSRVRRAVAEGWARRGVWEPLVQRSTDPAVFGPLAGGLVELDPTLGGLDRLLSLGRSPESDADAEAALLRFVNVLPPESLLDADRRFEASGAPVAVRLEGLRRIGAVVGVAISREVQEEALERRTAILLGLGRSDEVADLLGEQPLLPEQALFETLLEARLRAGRFDRAASQQPDPGVWIAVLERLAGDPATTATATAIAEEIVRRFGDTLTPAQLSRIEPHRATPKPAPAPVTAPPESNATPSSP